MYDDVSNCFKNCPNFVLSYIFKFDKTGIPGKCLPRDSKQIYRIYNNSSKLFYEAKSLLSALHIISRVMRRIKGSVNIFVMFTLNCRKVLSRDTLNFPLRVTLHVTVLCCDTVTAVSGMRDDVQVLKSGIKVHT